MYARVTSFTLGPGTRPIAENLAADVARHFTSAAGLRSIIFLANWDTGEYGTFQVWETKEAADAALPAIRQIFDAKAAGMLKGAPIRLSYEVFEPKL